MTRNTTQVAGSNIGTIDEFEYLDKPIKESRELYVFDPEDKLIAILSESNGLVSTWFKDYLNKVPDAPFTFTVEADQEQAQFVKEENKVVFLDKEGDFRLFVIKELDDIDNLNGPYTTAICEPDFMENKERIVVDRRLINATQQEALDAALETTRYEGEVEVSLGLATINFYYLYSIDAVWQIINLWGGDFKDVVEFDGNQITRRVIKIIQRKGADRGHRWEIDHNIEEIQRTVLSYPITALYGRGASLQTEGGGNTRYIDFADVAWSVANGDPVDKPLGQKWVGDPDALLQYGRMHEGQLQHREDTWSNQDYEDPAELLQATWERLQQVKKPEVNYQLAVQLLEKIAGYEHERASLGDTSRAIDRRFSRPIEIESRLIGLEYDVIDYDNTAQAIMGDFLSVDEYDNRVEQLEKNIELNRPKWEAPITDGSFPDTTPPVPTNIQAEGLFQTIMLNWDYDASSYIAAYEVYASQYIYFNPGTANLVYRGKSGGFAFDADVNQQWYFYLRSINTHGTPSAYSSRYTTTTLRINADTDIEDETITNKLIAKNAAIDFAKIANVVITNAMITNLDVDKLVGGTATFVRDKFNGVSSQVKVDYAGLETYSGGEKTSLVDGRGHRFFRDNLHIGNIGTSFWIGQPTKRGLSFQMTNDCQYMAWTHDDDGDGTYTTRLSWQKDGSISGASRGFTMSDDVKITGDLINFGKIDASGKINAIGGLSVGTTGIEIIPFTNAYRMSYDSNNFIRQFDSGQFEVVAGGTVRHAFYANGTKMGGSIEIDGQNLGMSPIDSPQILIEYIEFKIPLSEEGTKVYVDETYLKAVDNFTVFTNLGELIEVGTNYFIVAGNGYADCRIVGERLDYAGSFWGDTTSEAEVVEIHEELEEQT